MPKHQRRRFDDDLDEPPFRSFGQAELSHAPDRPEDETTDEPSWSTYPDAAHGPSPVPTWVITSANAIDTDLGVLKTGKEADVSLLRRDFGDESCLMAVKRYRDGQHRLFHRDAGYLEGRRVRRSREMRAMTTRTSFGRELISGQWAFAEFGVLSRFWSIEVPVPYPVQFDGTELIMEFIGTPDGVAAPRLAETRPSPDVAAGLYEQMRVALLKVVDAGYAHGDLSPYNVLVHDGRLVLIDLPQAPDIVGNPQGLAYLQRDCENICTWFAARGVDADAADLFDELLDNMPGPGRQNHQ